MRSEISPRVRKGIMNPIRFYVFFSSYASFARSVSSFGLV